MAPARARLVALLQLAYSGELAAALAYDGHAASVRDGETRRRIALIAEEERHHRRLVGAMLQDLASGPSPIRETRAALVGRILGWLCRLSGWWLPMYGAGRLESGNIGEYEAAARHAVDAGLAHLADCLLTMAETEWEHERYFRACVASHWLGRRLPLWPAPAPREHIRASFAAERPTGAVSAPLPAGT